MHPDRPSTYLENKNWRRWKKNIVLKADHTNKSIVEAIKTKTKPKDKEETLHVLEHGPFLWLGTNACRQLDVHTDGLGDRHC